MSTPKPLYDDLPGLPGKFDNNVTAESRSWLKINRPAGERRPITKDTERPPRSFLTSLPFEIREMIYENLLTCDTTAKQPSAEGFIHSIDARRVPVFRNTQLTFTDHGVSMAILRTCRQIYEEAYPVLLKSNIFVRVRSGRRLGQMLYSACVPVLATGKIATRFKQPAVEFEVPSNGGLSCPAQYLMLASSLPLLVDALTTQLPLEYNVLEDDYAPFDDIFLVEEDMLSSRCTPDFLRLLENCGRKMTLEDQHFVLSSFRRQYFMIGPGARHLQLCGPWNAGMQEAAEIDLAREVQEENSILGGHPARTCRIVELAKAYHRKGELRNAVRYFSVAHSRLRAVAEDWRVVDTPYIKKRHLRLSYVVSAYLSITLFDLGKQTTFETWAAYFKVLHNINLFEGEAVRYLKELAQLSQPVDEPEIVDMFNQQRRWPRLLYDLGIGQNPILKDPAVRAWACSHSAGSGWTL